MNPFEKLGVGEKLIKSVTELGFTQPTPIQEQAIPVLLTGNRDFMGLAQTGTGKTAAFGMPLLQLVNFESKKTQALILSPTRELCMQITRDIENFSKYIDGVKTVAVYGGASIQTQIAQIKRGVQIVVATPGRLLDLIDRRAIDISNINYVVLDEADEMLNMGFQEDINSILSNTPKEKQTWLFSATMPPEVRSIASKYMDNPFELTVGKKNQGAENIEHIYYVVHARDKYAALKRIVDYNPEIFAIVFCRTRMETQEISEKLIKGGYNADALHGDLSQQQRDKVMKRYRDRSLQVLVATDVAARGIDVDSISHVINYNLPDDIENYTHRSGRTARAGKSGVSIVIINMKEVGKIRQIERQINKKFTLGKIPDGFDVCEKQLFQLVNKVHDVEVNEKEIEKYLPKIYESLNDLSKEEIIKRFTSIEFNRFIEYYRNAPDLNVDSSRRESSRDNDSPREQSSGDRLFINLGSMDGMDTGSLLSYVLNVSGIDKSSVGKIDIKGVYSFFQVEKNDVAKVIAAFDGNEVFKGRPVRIEISGDRDRPSRGGDSAGGGNRRRTGSSGYGSSNERPSGERKRSYSSGSGEGYKGGNKSDSRGGSRPSSGSGDRKNYSDRWKD
jgi:ATP-dependent RNA helicase DeaD